jgi:hypothetical protein
MIFGWVLERFVGDFMPLLILASSIGTVDIWSRLQGKRRYLRAIVAPAVIGILALFGLLANVGFAITPTPGWTRVQADDYVEVQQALSNVTGHPLSRDVVMGSAYPLHMTMGQLFILGNCEALFVADQATPNGSYYGNYLTEVEHAPHTPLCHALLASARSIPLGTKIITPSPDTTVSGLHVPLVASASTAGDGASLSFVLSGGSLPHPTVLVGTTSGSGVWIYTWDTQALPNGSYTLRSVVTIAGQTATSPGVGITVRNRTASPTPAAPAPR